MEIGHPDDTARILGAAIDKVRSTSRPILIEVKTLRLRGHAAYDTCDYLRPGESDGFFAADPLPKIRERMVGMVGAALSSRLTRISASSWRTAWPPLSASNGRAQWAWRTISLPPRPVPLAPGAECPREPHNGPGT